MPTDFKDSRDADTSPSGEVDAGAELAYEATDERPSLTTRTREALYRFRVGLQEGMPLPLVIQGSIEAIQVYVLGLIVVAIPLGVAAASGGWLSASAGDVAHATGQWLSLIHI